MAARRLPLNVCAEAVDVCICAAHLRYMSTLIDANGASHDTANGQFATHRLGEADPTVVLGAAPEPWRPTAGTPFELVDDQGRLHSDSGPALVQLDGSECFYRHGVLDRVGGPAIVRADGTREWLRNGLHDRVGGPAIESADGTRFWMRGGRVTRTDGGPAIVRADGTQEWLVDNKHHRLDGPAIVVPATGSQVFYRDGQVHCDDGPAIRNADGTGVFFYRGIFCPDQAAFDELRGAE